MILAIEKLFIWQLNKQLINILVLLPADLSMFLSCSTSLDEDSTWSESALLVLLSDFILNNKLKNYIFLL